MLLRATLCFATAVVAALPLSAQRLVINLGGKPERTLAEGFSSVTGVRELSPTTAIIVDAIERRIALVDFATGHVTNIGRVGGGPGEFQMPNSVLSAPRGETWVPDLLANRVHVISGGKIVRAIAPPADQLGAISFQARGIDNAGNLYVPLYGRRDEPGGSDSLRVLRWNTISGRIDTVTRIASGFAAAGSGAVWTAIPNWVALPDGRVAIVRPSPYRVDFVAPGGRLTRGPEVAVTPIRVTDAERNAYRAARAVAPRNGELSRTKDGARLTQDTRPLAPVPDDAFPATLPPFVGQLAARATPEGHIWVQRSRAASDSIPKYDIFDGSGALVGAAMLRPRSAVVGFGAGTVYVARQDPADDLRYLEQYRLPQGKR
jgi:hypothetical protein